MGVFDEVLHITRIHQQSWKERRGQTEMARMIDKNLASLKYQGVGSKIRAKFFYFTLSIQSIHIIL